MESKQVIFGQKLGGTIYRCHAEITDSLPKITNKWDLGCAYIGEYLINGTCYQIYKNRAVHNIQWGYYAIERG